jgi:putative ATP-binding cassette transporter
MKEKRSLGGFLNLAGSYWVSEQRWKACGLLATVIALILVNVYMYVQLNFCNGLIFDSLQHYDKSRFLVLVARLTLISIIIFGIDAYREFVTQLLQMRWREWMSKDMLRRWFEHRTFYFMQIAENSIENPDQRIAEDVKEYTDLTITLSLGLLRQGFTIVSFLGILWSFSGILRFNLFGFTVAILGYLAFVSLIYSAIGSLITHKIGRTLKAANYDQERYEADFRFGLIRVRENAQSIALSRGEKAEETFLAKRFNLVISNFIK